MQQQRKRACAGCGGPTEVSLSRRAAVGSSGVALLGLLSGAVLGREPNGQGNAGKAGTAAQQGRERMDSTKAYMERMRNASSNEERAKIMEERRSEDRRRAVEDLKEQLGIADAEWPIVKPRIEAVYNLVHPLPQMGRESTVPRTEAQQRSSELRELLRDKNAAVDQIKAKLVALRSVKEKARQELAAAQQNLRQLMTVRQEAILVLEGLLD